MRPNLLITSGEEHEIFAGDNVPIPVAAARRHRDRNDHRNRDTRNGGPGNRDEPDRDLRDHRARERGAGGRVETGGTGTGRRPAPGRSWAGSPCSQNIERQDVGTSLRVTPTVGEQGGVMLELRVEVSSLAESAGGPGRRGRADDPADDVESTIRLAAARSR